MLKYCLQQWDANRNELENYIKNNPKEMNTCNYKDIVKLVVRFIYNKEDSCGNTWDEKRITEIDNGDYQGTLLYLIANNSYQPSEFEYLMTYAGYGSCSGCDTLQSIQSWGDEEKLSETQVSDFMKLCKDTVQNTIKPYNSGWREEDEYICV